MNERKRARGKFKEGEELSTYALRVALEKGEVEDKALPLLWLGLASYFQGNYDRATELCEQRRDIGREINDYWIIANSMRMVGLCAGLLGDTERAEELLAECREMAHDWGDLFTEGYTAFNASIVWLTQRKFEKVEALAKTGLRCLNGIGDKFGIVRSIEKLVLVIALKKDRPERAANLFGAPENLRNEIGWFLPATEKPLYDESIAAAINSLGQNAYEEAFNEGRRMIFDQAVEYALKETE